MLTPALPFLISFFNVLPLLFFYNKCASLLLLKVTLAAASVMTRHSKNNSSSGAFSYAERQKLPQYGTQAIRCTSENLRAVTQCHLCLQEAKQPNCCSQGHLACRECFLQDILAQKEAFKQAQSEAAADKARKSEEEAKKI